MTGCPTARSRAPDTTQVQYHLSVYSGLFVAVTGIRLQDKVHLSQGVLRILATGWVTSSLNYTYGTLLQGAILFNNREYRFLGNIEGG